MINDENKQSMFSSVSELASSISNDEPTDEFEQNILKQYDNDHFDETGSSGESIDREWFKDNIHYD